MLHVLDHPLAKHALTILRDKSTEPEEFRQATQIISRMLALEATKDLRTRTFDVQTPVDQAKGYELDESLAAIPVLRAGLGMLDTILEMFPKVDVGYVGLERHEETAVANSYYLKLPPLRGKVAMVLDPMLATGGSASQAIALIKARKPSRVIMVCIVAAPEGVQKLDDDHPEVPVYTAAVDDSLNDKKYIVPGVGDFGDRLFGT